MFIFCNVTITCLYQTLYLTPSGTDSNRSLDAGILLYDRRNQYHYHDKRQSQTIILRGYSCFTSAYIHAQSCSSMLNYTLTLRCDYPYYGYVTCLSNLLQFASL